MHYISAERIKSNSAELNEINRRISQASPERRTEWQAAVTEFHARFDELVYPGGGAMLNKVRAGDRVALELALRFLEVDPMHFRSGYLKEHLWRWLAHLALSRPVRRRLEAAALAYLDRRVSREFWAMAKTMHRIAGSDFWLKVANAAESAESPRNLRALYLLVHGADLHAGAMVRRQLFHKWLQEHYGGR